MFTRSLAMGLLGCLVASSFAATTNPVPPPASPPLPFSEGMMAGDTYYIAGHIGIDPATGQAAAAIDTEIKLVLDAVKQTVEQGGLGMDDLVSVTVYCTDLDLYDKFNAVYRTYFHSKYPTRTFIGVNKLLRGAHFEVSAVAAKHSAGK